jgi:hypothetical protein
VNEHVEGRGGLLRDSTARGCGCHGVRRIAIIVHPTNLPNESQALENKQVTKGGSNKIVRLQREKGEKVSVSI